MSVIQQPFFCSNCNSTMFGETCYRCLLRRPVTIGGRDMVPSTSQRWVSCDACKTGHYCLTESEFKLRERIAELEAELAAMQGKTHVGK
jgi:hypothetical protein